MTFAVRRRIGKIARANARSGELISHLVRVDCKEPTMRRILLLVVIASSGAATGAAARAAWRFNLIVPRNGYFQVDNVLYDVGSTQLTLQSVDSNENVKAATATDFNLAYVNS